MISTQQLTHFLESIHSMRIAVMGDIILDHYLYGQVHRISPEAPVPILLNESDEYRLGGAGNVFLNLSALDAQATLFGVIGHDDAGQQIKRMTSTSLVAEELQDRPTPVKTRLIANRQQILRIDREKAIPIEEPVSDRLFSRFSAQPFDALLLSDYAKGTLTPSLSKRLITHCNANQIPVIVDPKPVNIDQFQQATAITPNRSEAETILRCPIESNKQAAQAAMALRRRLKTQMAVITRGAQGVTAQQVKHPAIHLPAFSHEVFDVTGAGDTFAVLLVLGLIGRLPLKQTLWLANAAASLVIERIGAAAVSPKDLYERCLHLKRKVL